MPTVYQYADYWFCYYCSYGPFDVNRFNACTDCGRRRHPDSRVEKHRIRSRSPHSSSSHSSTAHTGSSSAMSSGNHASGSSQFSHTSSSPSFSTHYHGSGSSNTAAEGGPWGGYGALSVPAPPVTFGPRDFSWFCHECKDGPKNSAIEIRCVKCFHNVCYYCQRF